MAALPRRRADPWTGSRLSSILVHVNALHVGVSHRSPPPIDTGFVWNRLQLALLREALWIVQNGVASPAVVDETVRYGLARRWRLTGPFETVALGGVHTFSAVAANLFPHLSTATAADGLDALVITDQAVLAEMRERRDQELASELERDRAERAS